MGYVNRGPDPRILGPVGGWLQGALSFKRSTPPTKLINTPRLVVCWPPFVSLALPGKGDTLKTFRAGWRWDENWDGGGYIADVIIKLRLPKHRLPGHDKLR